MRDNRGIDYNAFPRPWQARSFGPAPQLRHLSRFWQLSKRAYGFHQHADFLAWMRRMGIWQFNALNQKPRHLTGENHKKRCFRMVRLSRRMTRFDRHKPDFL